MALLSKEGLQTIERSLKYSPVLAAAYITKATEVAAKVLLNRERVYPAMDYLTKKELPLDKRVDLAFIHSLFSSYSTELPKDLESYGNLTQVLRLIWVSHSAAIMTGSLFPGLRSSWTDFLEVALVPYLQRQRAHVPSGTEKLFDTLIDWVRDDTSVFYRDSDTFYRALKDLVDDALGIRLPLDPVRSAMESPPPAPEAEANEEAEEPEEAPIEPSEPSDPLQQESEPPAPDPLAFALQALEQYLQGQELLDRVYLEDIPATVEPDSRQHAAIDNVLRYSVQTLPTLAEDEEFVYWEVQPTQRARNQYARLAQELAPHVEHLRKLFTAVLHDDYQLELASSGRLHPHLLAKASLGLFPFVRLEPKEEHSLHMVFLLDESGSMNTMSSVPLSINAPSRGKDLIFLGEATPVDSNRFSMAKILAVLFYEALKQADVRMEFYGYGESSLPQTIIPSHHRSMWVRKLADNQSPYGLASTYAFSDNGDYAALSLAYQSLRFSSAKHRLVVYLADGEIRSNRLVKAIQRILEDGIHVIWLDLSGRDYAYRDSSLAMARRYAIRTFSDAVQVLPSFLQEVASW